MRSWMETRLVKVEDEIPSRFDRGRLVILGLAPFLITFFSPRRFLPSSNFSPPKRENKESRVGHGRLPHGIKLLTQQLVSFNLQDFFFTATLIFIDVSECAYSVASLPSPQIE